MKNNSTFETFRRLGLDGTMMLAPIAGYTDAPFRKISVKYGASLVVTELISAHGIVQRNKQTEAMLAFADIERPISIQIFGNNPVIMGEAAARVEERSPEVIDINMGCPAKKVCSGGSGASLLKDPEKMYQVVKSVRDAVSLPVSVKIRIGWNDHGTRMKEYLSAVESGGAVFLTIHGRTREEMYSGEADWDIISLAAQESSIPVVGNGDITNYDEAQRRLKESGCAAVMVGRGALGNPWIFSGRRPDNDELLAQVEEHMGLMTDLYGSRGIYNMRKHVVKYIHHVHNAAKIRKEVMELTSPQEVLQVMRRYLL